MVLVRLFAGELNRFQLELESSWSELVRAEIELESGRNALQYSSRLQGCSENKLQVIFALCSFVIGALSSTLIGKDDR